MALDDRTYPWSHRWSGGSLRLKQFFNLSFGYTETHKKVAAGTATAVLAATSTVVAGTLITTGITQPDVPRCLILTTGGTTADIAAGAVEIIGRNIEGKVITESFVMADNLNGTVTGIQAFKSITSIRFPAADNTGATIAIGTTNKLGLNHRLVPGKTAIGVISDADIDGTAPIQQGAPTASTVDAEEVEYNTVTPVTTPNGTTFLTIFYWYHNITLKTIDDNPEYATSTSTSSSTSTSTSLSTSTSISTSSTSVSTSSTSTSATTTSTSTTTAP